MYLLHFSLWLRFWVNKCGNLHKIAFVFSFIKKNYCCSHWFHLLVLFVEIQSPRLDKISKLKINLLHLMDGFWLFFLKKIVSIPLSMQWYHFIWCIMLLFRCMQNLQCQCFASDYDIGPWIPSSALMQQQVCLKYHS